MTTTRTKTHWANELDANGLHEPTVRAIIATMKRSGAGFGARVLEAQLAHDQISVMEKVQRARDIADFVEEHPDWPIDTEGTADWWPLTIWCVDLEDVKAKRREIGGRWEKGADGPTFQLKGRIGSAHVILQTSRDKVCERIVVGTETKVVPDPDAPKVEIEVDVVEWVCPDSLLGKDAD